MTTCQAVHAEIFNEFALLLISPQLASAIIFVAMGITLGHVGPSAPGLTTLVHPSTAK